MLFNCYTNINGLFRRRRLWLSNDVLIERKNKFSFQWQEFSGFRITNRLFWYTFLAILKCRAKRVVQKSHRFSTKSSNIVMEIKINIRNKSQSSKLLKCDFCFSYNECWGNFSLKRLYKQYQNILQYLLYYFILNSSFLQYREVEWKAICKDEGVPCNNYKLS